MPSKSAAAVLITSAAAVLMEERAWATHGRSLAALARQPQQAEAVDRGPAAQGQLVSVRGRAHAISSPATHAPRFKHGHRTATTQVRHTDTPRRRGDDLARAFECSAPHLEAFTDRVGAPDQIPQVRPGVTVQDATNHEFSTRSGATRRDLSAMRLVTQLQPPGWQGQRSFLSLDLPE